MTRCREFIVLGVTSIAMLGCGTSPAAPEQPSPAEFDPAALFATLAGPYALTFEADERCPLPSALEVVTYDVVLQPSPHRYLSVLVPGKAFVGDLWVSAREEDGFTLRWNVDCETSDAVGSTSFYLCGEGAAFVTGGAISGVLEGANVYFDMDHRPLCPNATHRFVFQRKS